MVCERLNNKPEPPHQASLRMISTPIVAPNRPLTATWCLGRESHAQGDYDNAEPLYRLGVRIADDVFAGRGDDGSTEDGILTVRMNWAFMLVAKVSALPPCLEQHSVAHGERGKMSNIGPHPCSWRSGRNTITPWLPSGGKLLWSRHPRKSGKSALPPW